MLDSYEGGKADIDDIDQSAYEDVSLGEYLDSLLPEEKRKRRTCYADNYGTIKDKKEFCRKALSAISDVEDISPHAIDLAERMYNFIEEQNR